MTMEKHAFKSGVFRQQYEYKSFSPSPINVPFRWADRRIDTLLEEATRYIGELNAFSYLLPDLDFFIHMHVVREATASSGIEGTRTGMEEAVMPQEEILPERKDDWQEVMNYTKAMNSAIEGLQRLPLSMRLLKEAHGVLLDGVRGEHKAPGEVRTSQNWIGGSSLKDAYFIPPHHEELPALLGDLEKFWHNESLEIPQLIKNAISHYQFETIHPFQDGNGRIGRLLITLHLIGAGFLNKPTLYMSGFLRKNKGAYFDALTAVRTSSDIEHWIRFFLVGIATVAREGKDTLQTIIALRRKVEGLVLTLGRKAKNGQELLVLLYSEPIVSARRVEASMGLTHPAVNNLIKDFQRLGILREITGQRKNRLFLFKEYMDVFAK
jgi:Fic family protein